MMKSVCRWATGAALLVLSSALLVAAGGRADAAGSVTAGRDKAQKCEVCHGLDGMSKLPEAPNIGGQPEQYLVKQIAAFKAGKRQNEMMSLVAKELSRKDIEDIAAYYAAIEVTVGKIPGQ
jgi:cytochrome c553